MAPAPKMMKAIQLKSFNAPYAVSRVPLPRPKPHQLLIRIRAAGFCHTDCMVNEGAFDPPLPLIGSHEPAGVVAEVGAEVQGFREGDRVGCINFEGACVKLPDSISFPMAACLMCAGISIYGGIKRAAVPPGGSIGIVGIGGLGHIGTQLAKAMGYKVVAIDVKQSALDLSASYPLNPDLTLLATTPAPDAVSQITQVVGGAYPGLDATVLATDAPAAFKFAAAVTRKHGTLVLLGQPDAGITMTYKDVIFRDLQLVGSLVASREDTEELLGLVAEHGVEVKMKEWRIEQAEEMRQEYLGGKGEGKNVVVFE
ncbi:alcohol dehydrogenase [Colletotrichum sp. SAR 10_70]|nr:alcohol dehydrogenase [Colletotrichum sp. SAR 10_71]KAI8185097.1 alcohol dehydrogenase [Colletotrichum sp. SAR 10_75]KAI8191256.1 alcohol dehydrogenase [Colletotrichum sp. SAR 10_70]KAI8223989.1 alcohol dehydrogenase [Colletotrichum sp. SAR 10_86]